MIAYSFVREGCAKDELRFANVKSEDNIADICTKLIFNFQKRMHLLSKVLHRLV